ncbi:MAG TPA: VWA-like domain-containing protein [Geobacteraceae bacterium]
MNRTLENAVVRLLKRRPFYGHLILACRREAGGGYPLGVTIRDGVAVLAVNAPRFAAAGSEVQEALLEHVVKHLLHLHMARRKGRNRHDWDLACDLAINPTIAGLPEDAALPSLLRLEEGLAAEEYYLLLHDPFDCGNLEGAGQGHDSRDEGESIGPGAGGATATVDDHAIWDEADSTPVRLAEEVVRGLAREALRAAADEVPPDVRPLVDGLIAPAPIPWRHVLRQFVAAAGRVGRTTTWMREHRRFSHDTPGVRKRYRLNLLVGVDVSDSTDTVELREAFARELVRVARGRESLLTVVYANSRVQQIESFRGSAVLPEVHRGGGFTDLRPLFDYARSLHPRPAAVIYLTDGLGPAPEQMEFPTLWVLTGEGEKPVPWGVELRLGV